MVKNVGLSPSPVPGNENSPYVAANQPINTTARTGKPETGTDSFSTALSQAQQTGSSPSLSAAPVSRWSSLSFLTTSKTPRIRWPWTQSAFGTALDASAQNVGQIRDLIPPQVLNPHPTPLINPIQPKFVVPPTLVAGVEAPPADFGSPMALADYPRPTGDNGRGIHWIPTISQSPEVIDNYVEEAKEMGMKWVLLLNEGTNIGNNDYLVEKLTEAGIEPIMRIYTPGVVPIEGDLTATVKHYTQKGVSYFQLYNEPNLRVETGGQPADVEQYLDYWTDAAQQVLDGGGLPGFGALSPQGEMDDRQFLTQALHGLKARGQEDLLNRGWLSMHNYTGPRPLTDPDGFMRFKQYNTIINDILGRPLPVIGTEGGTHVTEQVSQDQQIAMVTGAYDYMAHREPYNFAYTYWIIANGHDSAWDEHSLFKPDGPTPLVQALKDQASGGRV